MPSFQISEREGGKRREVGGVREGKKSGRVRFGGNGIPIGNKGGGAGINMAVGEWGSGEEGGARDTRNTSRP